MPLCWPQWWPSHPAGTIQIRRSQLTERAGQLGEGERLASAGHHVTHSALSAATAALLEKAKSPTNGPFPPKPGRRLLTGSANEFEVEESASGDRIRMSDDLVDYGARLPRLGRGLQPQSGPSGARGGPLFPDAPLPGAA